MTIQYTTTSLKKTVYSLSRMMRSSIDDVFLRFMSLPGAFTDGSGSRKFVYVPGTRADRVLLCAHADTVWGQADIKVAYCDGIMFSPQQDDKHEYKNRFNTTVTRTGIGLGADDRAGCSILWSLRNLGHSLLITAGEEIGQLAAKRIMTSKWWKEEIASHQFAIQFDRRGSKDIVFYDVATKQFVDYVVEQTGYKPQYGSATDIKTLCDDICGVNISVGYYNEHTAEEKLVVQQWMNTLQVVKKWLSGLDIPQYPMISKDRFTFYSSKYFPKQTHYSGYTSGGQGYTYSSLEYKITPTTYTLKQSIFCDSCQKKMELENWMENKLHCIFCGHAV